MAKCTYTIKYTLLNDLAGCVFVRKVRAVTEKEAYARFKRWVDYYNHPIKHFWLERGDDYEDEG